MPRKNPKHEIRLKEQGTYKKGKLTRNWKKIGVILVIFGTITTIIVIGIYYGTFQQKPENTPAVVKDGDQVYIYYEVRDANGTLIDQSPAGGKLFTISRGAVIDGFYDNVIGMHVGESKNFTIDGCPTHDCSNYEGYTKGDMAWMELHFFVTIASI